MMTELRKKLQAKLRRKWGYQTNTNKGRGTVLIKPWAYKNGDFVTDLTFAISSEVGVTDKHRICIYETDYDTVTGVESGESRTYLSLEELDVICAIAHELIEKER